MGHPTLRAAARPSRGFSLVELIVAMMLVAVGILSLVGANTVLVRRRMEARQRLAAVSTGANRVARLASGPCRPSSGTASTPDGISERWAVVTGANATRDIVDSVHFGARPARDVVFRTRLPC